MYGYGNTLLAKVVSFPLAAGHNILGITDAEVAGPDYDNTEGRPFKRTFLELPTRPDGDYSREDAIEEDAGGGDAGGGDGGDGKDAEEGGAGGGTKPTVRDTLKGKKIGEVALPSSIPNIKIVEHIQPYTTPKRINIQFYSEIEKDFDNRGQILPIIFYEFYNDNLRSLVKGYQLSPRSCARSWSYQYNDLFTPSVFGYCGQRPGIGTIIPDTPDRKKRGRKGPAPINTKLIPILDCLINNGINKFVIDAGFSTPTGDNLNYFATPAGAGTGAAAALPSITINDFITVRTFDAAKHSDDFSIGFFNQNLDAKLNDNERNIKTLVINYIRDKNTTANLWFNRAFPLPVPAAAPAAAAAPVDRLEYLGYHIQPGLQFTEGNIFEVYIYFNNLMGAHYFAKAATNDAGHIFLNTQIPNKDNTYKYKCPYTVRCVFFIPSESAIAESAIAGVRQEARVFDPKYKKASDIEIGETIGINDRLRDLDNTAFDTMGQERDQALRAAAEDREWGGEEAENGGGEEAENGGGEEAPARKKLKPEPNNKYFVSVSIPPDLYVSSVSQQKRTWMSLELFLEQIELADNTTNDNTFDVFYDINTKYMHAFENDVDEPREFVYKLKGEQDDIAKEHRYEILKYCLGRVTPEDEVCLGDIFLHAKFIEKIS